MGRSIRTSTREFTQRARNLVQRYGSFLEFVNETQLLAQVFGSDAGAVDGFDLSRLDNLQESEAYVQAAKNFQDLSSGGLLAAEVLALQSTELENADDPNAVASSGVGFYGFGTTQDQDAIDEQIDALEQQLVELTARGEDTEALNGQLANLLIRRKIRVHAPGSGDERLDFMRQPNQIPRVEVFETESFIDEDLLRGFVETTLSARLTPTPLRAEEDSTDELTSESRERVTLRRPPSVDTNALPPFRINGNPLAPSPDNPGVGPNLMAIFVNDVNLMPASRDTGLAEVFFNFVPTTEISRAVPYLDIGLISPVVSTNQVDPAGSKPAVVSLASALGYTAPGGDTAINLLFDGPDARETGDLETKIKTGMELFTSPATLTAASRFVEPDDLAVGLAGGPSGPLDPFRPPATLQSVSFTTVPTTGLIPYKTAQMKIVVHDRSRLSELAPFISPALYSRNHIYMEYGWSHPDDDIEANPVGYLINSLRVIEKYTIVNSSFSLDASGDISVDVTLSMRGSENLNLSDINRGEGVEAVIEKIDESIEAIQGALRALNSDESTRLDVQELFPTNVLGAVSSTDASVSALDDELKEEIYTLINGMQGSQNPNVNIIRDNFARIFGQNESADGSLNQQLRASISAAIELKRRILYNGIDPFLPDGTMQQINPRGGQITDFTFGRDTYVSLAKLLMVFVGKPLAATRRFDEVQMVFYPFNRNASNLRNQSVGSFPIKRSDFLKLIQEESKTTANIPLGRFISLVDREFVSNQASDAYGMSMLYGPADENGNRELVESLQEDRSEVINLKQKLMQRIYGTDSEIRFSLPSVGFQIEAVPRQASSNDPNSGAAGTILRIHVYDNRCTPHESFASIYRSARTRQFNAIREYLDPQSDDMGHQSAADLALNLAVQEGVLELSTATSTPDGRQLPRTFRVRGGTPAIKRLTRRLLPTLRFGTQGSGATSVTFSSNSDPSMTTINMLRSGNRGDNAPGVRDGGLPLEVTPTEAAMDTFGFPFWSIGQQFFVDFDTNTTADNIYGVSSVSHTLEPGNFTSQVKLIRTSDAFGEYRSLSDQIANAMRAMSDATGEAEE